jgi:ATP-binding cassette subfamily B protein
MGFFLSGVEVLAVLALIWGSKYMRVVFLSVRESRGKVSRTLADVVAGVGETYYTKNNGYITKRGEVVFDDFLKKQLHSNVWDASYYSLAESLYPIFLSLVVLFFPYSGIAQAMVVFSIVDLIQRSINPIKSVSGKMANVQRALSGFQRIKEFLDHLDDGDSSKLGDAKELLSFSSVRVKVDKFAYDKGDFSLKDIDFKANVGELIGIVGLSGCGKSTVLNILSGQIIPQAGGVCLEQEGKAVLNFPHEHRSEESYYRQHVGLVSQDSHIFSRDLKFNIDLGQGNEKDFKEFWERMCEKTPYLLEWGLGLDSMVNPKELSLGQRQLIAALRSLYLRKKIVLFDEISSGLDSKLELSLRQAMLSSLEQSLTVVVAHRIETVMRADKIIVMDRGLVVGQGVHSELIKDNVPYQKFIEDISHSPNS